MQTNSSTHQESSVTRFALGQTYMTPGAEEALMIAGQTGIEFLRRHMSNDWGELSDEDMRENELSLKEGFRLLSAYRTAKGQKLWIITEADRSATTILLRTNTDP
jgi:histidine ammonia-lyase